MSAKARPGTRLSRFARFTYIFFLALCANRISESEDFHVYYPILYTCSERSSRLFDDSDRSVVHCACGARPRTLLNRRLSDWPRADKFYWCNYWILSPAVIDFLRGYVYLGARARARARGFIGCLCNAALHFAGKAGPLAGVYFSRAVIDGFSLGCRCNYIRLRFEILSTSCYREVMCGYVMSWDRPVCIIKYLEYFLSSYFQTRRS